MNKLMFKIGGSIATGAIIASAFAGATFADNSITDNGAKSTNTISVISSCTVSVGQSNVSSISAKVDQSASTGGNNASNNTGGDVTITTGDVNQTATVTVDGSSNTVENLPNCCVCQESVPADNTVSGNGKKSTNTIAVVTTQSTGVSQSNVSSIKAKVKQTAKTGKNKAKGNTNGTTSVSTGTVTSDATVGVTGSSNSL